MIRINLLPVSKARRQEALIVQMAIGVIFLFLVGLGCYFIGLNKSLKISAIQKQIEIKQREIDELKAKVGEVEKYKSQAQVLQEQLAVIRSLEAGRGGPVRMMDELTDLVPNHLWLNTFKETQKKVTLDGVADSGPVIADFLDNLKTSKFFSNPVLVSVTAQEQDGQKLQKFVITATVKYGS